MRVIEQYLRVVAFTMQYIKVVLTFRSVDEIQKCGYSVKAISSGQCFTVLAFSGFYNAVLMKSKSG